MTRINNINSAFDQRSIMKASNYQAVTNPNELSESLAGGTNINGVIDDFNQGSIGDCYLLSQLKNMSRKSWGAKAIKEAIEPDGMGGAYVTFKGASEPGQSHLKKPMRIHVSVEEILRVREKQNSRVEVTDYNNIDRDKYIKAFMDLHQFSSGDDDVLLIELAYNKYLNKLGLDIDGGPYSRIGDGRIQYEYDFQLPKLLIGSEKGMYIGTFGTSERIMMDKALTEVRNNDLDNYILSMSFKPNNKYGLLDRHAYEIIGFETDRCGNPMIILGNPHNTSKQIVMNYYDVLESAQTLLLWENPEVKSGQFSDFGALTHENNHFVASDEECARMDSLQNLYHNRHEECLREEEEEHRMAEIEEKYSVVEEILNAEDKTERLDNLKKYFQDTKPETVNPVLKEKYADIIKRIFQAESGIFHRKSRKALMTPLIEYVAEQAKIAGVEEEKINDFKNICNKTLSRFFSCKQYVIRNAFEQILNEILIKNE